MPLEPETIVAISTPPGRGGIGIVRLSGSRARQIAGAFLQPSRPLEAGRARFTRLLDAASGNVLDEAVATFFAAPNSYTSEDVVEIATHGSPVILDHVLRASITAGARLAEPGEFTQRAFLSGRLDLTQAEAVHDLIQSSTLHQARVAASQLGGALSQEIGPIKRRLVELIAALEAGIDFAEDDIDLLPAEDIVTRIREIRCPLEALERTFAYGRIVREGFTLALVGRPNAGKSSLFNALLERDRAIVTATPGTTRDLVTEKVSLDGIPVDLIDTAGIRGEVAAGAPGPDHGLDEAEAIGIAKSRQAMADADVVLLVVDANLSVAEEDLAIVGRYGAKGLLVALNKIDLAPSEAQIAALQSAIGTSAGEAGISSAPVCIPTSALKRSGLAELRSAIHSALHVGAPSGASGLLSNARQHGAVSAAISSLLGAEAALAAKIPHEMLLIDLHAALEALDRLTGSTSTEEILSLIFSTFCIGK